MSDFFQGLGSWVGYWLTGRMGVGRHGELLPNASARHIHGYLLVLAYTVLCPLFLKNRT